MSHNEERASWIREGLIGTGVGFLYGATGFFFGHPFDTIKTKMQAQNGYEKGSMVSCLVKIIRSKGPLELYRGSIPPLWGTGLLMSTQFATFEAVYTFLDNTKAADEIPNSAGLQYRVLIAGMVSGIVRSIPETPLEFAKTRRQTNQNWMLTHSHIGSTIVTLKNIPFVTIYFTILDSGRRHMPKPLEKSWVEPFILSSTAATLAAWAIWPLETLKSQIQSASLDQQISIRARLKQILGRPEAMRVLYRGFVPGTWRSFVSNGASMIVMINAQHQISEWGLRK